MTQIYITNLLIGLLIALSGYIGKMIIGKIDKFEQTIQDILINDMADKKDIENIKEDVKNHETRITNLENS